MLLIGPTRTFHETFLFAFSDLYEKTLQADPFGASAVVSLVKVGSIRKSQGDISGARTAFEEARAHPKCSAEWASTIAARLNELSS